MNNRDKILAKYQNSASFKKEMDKAEENYNLLYQKALYSKKEGLIHNYVVKLNSKHKNQCETYIMQNLPINANLHTRILSFISILPKPKNPYTIVFINSKSNSNSFGDFRDLLQILPIEYYLELKKIIIFKPTVSQKAMSLVSFGTVQKIVNSKIQFVSGVKELCTKLQCDFDGISQFLPTDISPKKQKISKQKGQQKIQIQEYDIGLHGVPILLQTLLYYFKQHPEGAQLEGIFRKSANIQELNAISGQLWAKNYTQIDKIDDPHLAANLIKKFFNNLATPIIPYHIYNSMMQQNNISPAYLKSQVHQIAQTDLTKLLSLMVLLDFLITNVIAHEKYNKMDTKNLAICFAPCLMKAQVSSLSDFSNIKKAVDIVEMMIRDNQKIFGNKREQSKMFRDSYSKNRRKSINTLLKQNIIQMDTPVNKQNEIVRYKSKDSEIKNTLRKQIYASRSPDDKLKIPKSGLLRHEFQINNY